MADDSDYMVPCGACGGWIHFIFDVEQPHANCKRSVSAPTTKETEQ